MDFTYSWRITILYPAGLLFTQEGIFFPLHWARSEKVEFTQEIGRELRKREYTEMLKDRCCRLRVMNILLRHSPLKLFKCVFLKKKEKGNVRNKHKNNSSISFFLTTKVFCSLEFRNWLWRVVCHFISVWVIAFSLHHHPPPLPLPLCYLAQSSAIPPL